ncbi:MAG: chromosomal replication initiation protein DnaA [Zetaproteobacteria bacterium CG2_30_46_52]|nr:MAG: chromosomal replication initiation protein DnaA [Zetaproteobacteria bacterium CG2_30_46_52]
MNHQEQWNRIKDHLSSVLSPAKMGAWIEPISSHFASDTLTLKVPSQFFIDGIRSDCEKDILDALHALDMPGIKLDYFVDTSIDLGHGVATPVVVKKSNIDGFIDERFTFENFVVGSSNEFCHAASLAVVDQPGAQYNPLYIHGGVGLGKTHLINAIANKLADKGNIQIAYRTGEHFTNELIESIRTQQTSAFRNKYRKVDVLIIDDIQFIEGKQSTQEEFFHTFDALHKAKKQIILTSDRDPSAIKHLAERLRSRFNWGLVADIQPPNFETRMAILKSKVEIAGISLDDDICFLLASKISSNVRELEGALTRLTAYAKLSGQPITMALAQDKLRDQLQMKQVTVSIEDIQKQVAQFYNIRTQDMKSKVRKRNIAYPRQVAMYLCKELTKHSMPEIAERFEKKDHTTILYAYRKIQEERAQDANFDDEITRLIKLLKQQ